MVNSRCVSIKPQIDPPHSAICKFSHSICEPTHESHIFQKIQKLDAKLYSEVKYMFNIFIFYDGTKHVLCPMLLPSMNLLISTT